MGTCGGVVEFLAHSLDEPLGTDARIPARDLGVAEWWLVRGWLMTKVGPGFVRVPRLT